MAETNYAGLLANLSATFEEMFQFTPKHYLKAGNQDLNRVSQWWNENRIMVILITGVNNSGTRRHWDEA